MDEPPRKADTISSLGRQGEVWRQHYEARDWDALRALYADDAVLMTQGQSRIEGADAIVAFLRRVPDSGGTAQFVFENEDISTNAGWSEDSGADTGFVTAKYRMTISYPGRDPIVVAGRSFLVYKWQDGEWRLWRDIDNLAPDVTPKGFTD